MTAHVTNMAAAIALALILGGCASTPKYACGVPIGIGCKPVRAVYQASLAGVPAITADTKRTADVSKGTTKAAPADSVSPGDPLLSRPRQLRVWIARWEDADGDLVDESNVYLRLDRGSWVIAP